jgi:hypothetical protein
MTTNLTSKKTTAKVVLKTQAKPATKPITKLAAKPSTKVVTKAVKKPVAKQPKASAPETAKVKKTKLVRDSFTIPKNEFLALQQLKNRAIALASPAKKGELLRAGLQALTHMADTAFIAALAAIPALKTGRPKGGK